ALIPALDSSNGWLVAIPGMAGDVASFLELRYHQGKLCKRCMASFLLHATNAAERSRLAMRVAHLMVERPNPPEAPVSRKVAFSRREPFPDPALGGGAAAHRPQGGPGQQRPARRRTAAPIARG